MIQIPIYCRIKHCQNEIKDEIDHLKTENKKATESILDLIKTEFKKQELDKRECSCFQKRQKFKSKNKAEQQFLKIKKNPSNSSEDSSIKSIMIIEEKKICDILLSQNNIKNKRKQKQSQNIEFERLKKNNSKIAAGHASPTYTSAKLEESNGQLSLPISSLNKTCVLATKRKEMLNKLCNKYSKNDKKNEVKREKNIDKISTRATWGRGKKKANKS